MKNRFEKLDELNATVLEVPGEMVYGEYENGQVELKTLQDPVVSDDGLTYSAPAVDVFENEYRITWEVTNFKTADESEVCDWDNPVRVDVSAI